MSDLASLQARLPRLVQDVARALDRAGAGPVAWSGPGGVLHYRLAGNPYVQMEELSRGAGSDAELLGLALGWYTARCVEGMQSPLTLVLETEPEVQAQEVLVAMTSRELDVLLVLLDTGQWSGPGGWRPFSREVRQGQSPAALAQQLDLRFLGTVDGRKADRLERELEQALGGQGVRVLHVKGEPPGTRPAPAESADGLPPAGPDPAGSQLFESPGGTLLEGVLNGLAQALEAHPQLLFWTVPAACRSLARLGQRLVHTGVRGVARQAAGACLAGVQPMIAVAATDLPDLLPYLFEWGRRPLTLLVLGSGLSPCGSSHYHPAALADLALLRTVPGLAVTCPADEQEAIGILRAAPEWGCPLAVRFTSAPSVGGAVGGGEVLAGKGRRLRSGRDAAILATGSTVFPSVLAAESLRAWGVDVAVYDMRFVRPLDLDLLTQAADFGRLVTVEEHRTRGGLGTAVLEGLSRLGKDQVVVRCLGLPDGPLTVPDGPALESFDLHAEGIARSVRRELGLNAPDEF